LGWPGLKPLGMTGLAEEIGFVVTPRLNGALGMPRNCATAGALEVRFFGLAFGQELANKGQDYNAHDYCPDDEFR